MPIGARSAGSGILGTERKAKRLRRQEREREARRETPSGANYCVIDPEIYRKLVFGGFIDDAWMAK